LFNLEIVVLWQFSIKKPSRLGDFVTTDKTVVLLLQWWFN